MNKRQRKKRRNEAIVVIGCNNSFRIIKGRRVKMEKLWFGTIFYKTEKGGGYNVLKEVKLASEYDFLNQFI